MAEFQGYLHADAYGGYDRIYLGSSNKIREVACWAHAQRKFFDAQSSSPRDAHQILEWIGQLYDIEERARELSADARRELRAAEAVPVLDRLGTRLAELGKRALPKSPLAKAVSYARNQWQALCRYTEDGRLTIDNNVSANARCVIKQSGEKTGCSWAASKPDRGRPSCSPSSPVQSAIGSSRGRTCVSFCSDSTTTTQISMRCSLINGRSNIPSASSTTALKSRAAKRPLGVGAAVTYEPSPSPANLHPQTMPWPDAYRSDEIPVI